jgi:hypothetical protein
MHDGGRAEQRCASRYRQVATLAARIMDWLAPGGHVFFRESCFHQSGNKPRDSNPSHYRNPEQYEAIFAVCARPSDSSVDEAVQRRNMCMPRGAARVVN